ncbi:zinc finger CW-type PWWP domain protein 1 [Caerostris darwini]|uniref:Zinc finger CW-type PWWP domain protein 1 n=1 Tax=Caerostris darwini TaxID=1538125 RepID=A0AAV4WTC6_9ARAC|nr:zinc finger CW-type PWWP domain protein 1 [Caerostris darwini]
MDTVKNKSQGKKRTKKSKETTRDRHLKWIDHYCSKNFGIWIECTKCKKWRKDFLYKESHEVPKNWCCSMLTLENGGKGKCDDPAADIADEEFLNYSPGSIVWAKLDGYPWWPAMVDENSDIEEFVWKENGITHYNVTFLDKRVTHAWILERFIRPFSNHFVGMDTFQKHKQNKYAIAIREAKQRAETALKMPIKDRLKTFSFAYLFKGHWPSADNYEENDCENITDALLKEVEDLESNFSTHSDVSENEDLFIRNKEIIHISAANIENTAQEKYNTKYLNDKDFISPSEAVFPFIKSKNSFLKTKISDNQVTAENITHSTTSLKKKKVIGIKRKNTEKQPATKKIKNFVQLNASTMSKPIIEEVQLDLEETGSKTAEMKDDNKEESLEEKSVEKDNNSNDAKNFEQNKILEVSDNLQKEQMKEMNNELNIPKTNMISAISGNDSKISQHIDESILEVIKQTGIENGAGTDTTNTFNQKEISKTSNHLKTGIKKKSTVKSQIVKQIPSSHDDANSGNEALKHIDELISEVINGTEESGKEALVKMPSKPVKTVNLPKNCKEKTKVNTVKKNSVQENKILHQSLEKNTPAVKIKPNFKHPSKTNRQVTQISKEENKEDMEIEKEEPFIKNESKSSDINKNSSCKTIEMDENDSLVIRKPSNISSSEPHFNETKNQNIEYEKDSSGGGKSSDTFTKQEDEDIFVVSLSDSETD